MVKESDDTSGAFDLRTLRSIVKIMNENELTEVDLRNGGQRIRLRKSGDEQISALASPVAPTSPTPQVSAPANTASTDASTVVIKSPMLGTFYRSSSPDAEPYAQVGTIVQPDTTICIIEAMKVFNEIPAEAYGKIEAVLVENGHSVEYGQPLFRLNPSA